MRKSEMMKETRKARARVLQRTGFSALLLIMIEIIVWNVRKMSVPLLVAILATCAAEIAVSLISLKELYRQEKDEK